MSFTFWPRPDLKRAGPPGRAGAALWPVLAALGWVSATPPAAAEPAAPGTLQACLAAVADTRKSEISCEYMALLTDEERADMVRLTRGLLQDVRCLVKVRVARTLVDPALKAADHTFEAPPQPVHCDIATSKGPLPVEATFAPQVVFKDGKATYGTPGLANVTGVHRYLAWPVVQYVNRAPGIRASMLEMINLYREKLTAP